jgi:hypothetical protein
VNTIVWIMTVRETFDIYTILCYDIIHTLIGLTRSIRLTVFMAGRDNFIFIWKIGLLRNTEHVKTTVKSCQKSRIYAWYQNGCKIWVSILREDGYFFFFFTKLETSYFEMQQLKWVIYNSFEYTLSLKFLALCVFLTDLCFANLKLLKMIFLFGAAIRKEVITPQLIRDSCGHIWKGLVLPAIFEMKSWES